MYINPKLIVDLAKIRHNAANIASMCRRFGIEVTAVTKAVCAAPEVARSMLAGGISKLADSRLSNIALLRESGINAHMTLLRSPMLQEVRDAAALTDRVLISDTPVLGPLSTAASELGKTVEVVLMVDLGDLREGFWPQREPWHSHNTESVETLPEAISLVTALPGLRLVGIGANLACFGAIIPTVDKMNLLKSVARSAELRLGQPFAVVSGGNSANMQLIMNGAMPPGVTELRIGEGILLGTESVNKRPIPGCFQDACIFAAEVIEVRRKPSVPIGEIGVDAFGGVPHFEDRGVRSRAILAAGRQDSDWEDMTALEAGIKVIGSSSDHLVLDVSDRATPTRVGDEIRFTVGYSCLLRAATSEYVRKVYM